jgi:chromosome segregation ATPase
MSIFKVSYSKYVEKKDIKHDSDLDRKILSLEEQFSKERGRHQSEKKTSGNISNLISLKKAKVEQLYQKIEETTFSINELEKSKKELKISLSDLEDEYDTLSSNKKKVNTQSLDVSDEVFKTERLIKEKQLAIDDCIREIDDQSQSFYKRTNLLAKILDDLKNLEIQFDEINESIFQKKDESKELNKNIDLAREKNDNKNNEINELKLEFRELNDKIVIKKNEFDQCKLNELELKKKIIKINEEYKATDNKIKVVEQELEDVKLKICVYQTDIQKEHDTRKKMSSSIFKQLELLKSESDKLKKTSIESSLRSKKLRKTCIEKVESCNELETINKKMSTELISLESNLVQQQNKLEELKKREESLKTEKVGHEKHMARFSNENLEKAKSQIIKKSKVVEQLEVELSASKVKIDKCNQEFQKMEERSNYLAKKNKSLTKDSLKIEEVLKSHFGSIVKVNDKIKILINEREELDQVLENCESALAKTLNEKNEKERLFEELSSNNNKLSLTITEKNNRSEALKGSIEFANQESQKLNLKNANISLEIEKKKSENKALSTDYEQLNYDKLNKNNIHKKLMNELNEIELKTIEGNKQKQDYIVEIGNLENSIIVKNKNICNQQLILKQLNSDLLNSKSSFINLTEITTNLVLEEESLLTIFNEIKELKSKNKVSQEDVEKLEIIYEKTKARFDYNEKKKKVLLDSKNEFKVLVTEKGSHALETKLSCSKQNVNDLENENKKRSEKFNKLNKVNDSLATEKEDLQQHLAVNYEKQVVISNKIDNSQSQNRMALNEIKELHEETPYLKQDMSPNKDLLQGAEGNVMMDVMLEIEALEKWFDDEVSEEKEKKGKVINRSNKPRPSA